MAFLLVAFVAGCSGGQSTVLGEGGIAGIAPAVTATSPVINASGVPINTKIITATFTKAMDPATLTTASFTLACPAGTPQTGVVSYVASGGVAIMSLSVASALPANTLCTAMVTTAAKDTSGVPLTSNFVWAFTTAATPDHTAPTVTGTIHTNGATNVAINTKVGATFSETMDPLTINSTTFTLKQGATAVSGTVIYAGVNAVFTPSSNLAPSTTYTVTVTTGAKDVRGNPMANDFVISWTTAAAPDTTAPTVTGTIHTNGATNVAINTAVGAMFSEGMDSSTITNLNFTLTNDAGAVVPGTVSYSGVNAIFRPLSNLANSTHYNVTVKGGAGGVKDLAGNPMANDFKLGWTTAAAADTTAPTVTGTIHTNGQTNVSINTAVGATFSEGMDPLTITNLSFTLTTDAGATVPGTVSYSGVSAVFRPLSNLANSTHYNVTVKCCIGGAKDLAGNPMAVDFKRSWTTAANADTTAPVVTGAIHTNGQTNVAINTAIGITFSEVMDPLTVTNLSFTLTTDAGVAVPGTVSYSGMSAIFRPLSDLSNSTHYNVTVKGGIGGVKDLAGNSMANDFIIRWATTSTADTTAPTVTGTIHANGSTNIPFNTKAGATFSEGMDPLTITNVNFTLKETVTGTAVAGTVGYSGINAVFTIFNDHIGPDYESFALDTSYTATIKGGVGGVLDLAGNPMASDYEWSWTTGVDMDYTEPTVSSTTPQANAADVAINSAVNATFSEAMDPLTITTTSFILLDGETPVAGTVTYDMQSNIATFTPINPLAINTTYTAQLSQLKLTDIAGNHLVIGLEPISWSFTTATVPQ